MSEVQSVDHAAEPAVGLPDLTPKKHLTRFRDDESGALLIFGLVLFVLMLMMGGLAVDLMRHETTRTLMQQTLDRSVLAAASRKQALDPASVVTDYFAKAGLSSYLNGVTVSEGLNFRNVRANALADTHPFFMHMMGVDEFVAAARSTAEERVSNVEIALVLDISGSMIKDSAGNPLPEPSKLTSLKAAASEFVDTVLAGDTDNRVSITIVPYNGQVNLGPDLIAKYNATDASGVANVNCVDLPSSVYNTAGLSRTLAMPHTGYSDSYSGTNQSSSYVAYTDTNYGVVGAANTWCPAKSANIVRLPSHDATTLKANINAIEAVGATSINAGMKWGLALLDPGSQTMFSELIGAAKIPAYFAGRPFSYTDPEAMKVIVLMTDGSHFPEERLNAGYRGGPTTVKSPIYLAADGKLSIDHGASKGTNRYFVPHLSTSPSNGWQATPYKSGTTTPVQQTWQEVWSRARMQWVAWQLYARANTSASATFTAQMNLFRTKTGTTSDVSIMDGQLQQVCSLARTNNVVVFGIAFEAPALGKTQIRNCSFTPSYYYEALGPTGIKTVFRQIASQISQLRLTQ